MGFLPAKIALWFQLCVYADQGQLAGENEIALTQNTRQKQPPSDFISITKYTGPPIYLLDRPVKESWANLASSQPA